MDASLDPISERGGAQAAVSDDHIGSRLRARRKVRGLSLKAVAARAQVSIGLLSQIERGLSMPSVRSLSAICAALEMPVSWLFRPDEDQANSQVVVRRHARRILDLGAKGMAKELMTPDHCPGIQMMRLIIRPGGSTGDQPYSHPQGTKCGTVLSGTLGLEVDGEVLRLDSGDSFAFEATCCIRFWCEGAEDAVVLWVVAPAVY